MHTLLLVLSFFAMRFLAPEAMAVTLSESYQSALNTNVTEKMNDARINQTIEQRRQEKSEFLPTIGLRGTYNKQDNSERQQNAALFLSQSLYNGGRNSLAVENANTEIEIARNERQLDRKALLLRVIEAYYTYFLNINDMNNLDLLRKQSKERADEIRKRVQIGRSRRGELLQAEAQLAAVDAQVASGQGLWKESESVFTLLTGLPVSAKPEVNIAEGVTAFASAKSLEDYLRLAFEQEDFKNRKLQIEQLNRSVQITKTHFLPTLDLTSNYYLDKKGGTTASRNSDWDVGLSLVFPLYEGGASDSLVRETLERRNEATYELNDHEKTVQIEVTRRYETFRRYSEQIKAFDLAMEKGKRSYEEAVKDYRLGLVSNLDVLSALNIYLDNKRNAEKTRIQAMMSKQLLDAVAGELK